MEESVPDSTFGRPVTLNHRGRAMYFVARPGTADKGDAIYYNVLAARLESTDKAEDWDGYTELKFPAQVSLAGVHILRLERTVLNKGFFKAITDQQYIYIVRAAKDALYINRYVMVERPNPNIQGETKIELQPAWEVRYQRSEKPDTPAGDKDTQSFVDMDGKEFLEPILELPFGWQSERLDFSKAWFDVSLLPTNTAGVLRWLFLVADQKNGALLSYSMDRSQDGWFQFAESQFDESNKLIGPDIVMGFKQGQDPLKVAGPPALTIYNKQEPVETGDATVLRLRQAYRLMACCQLNTTANASRLGVLDIAIAQDGKLVYPPWTNHSAPESVSLGPIQPASYGLRFDGESWISLAGEALTLGDKFTQQIWIYSTVRDENPHTILGGKDVVVEAVKRPPSIWIMDRFRIGVGFGTGTVFLSTETVGNVLNSNAWNNIIAIYQNGKYGVWVNGAPVKLKEHDFAPAKPGLFAIDGIGGRSQGAFLGDAAELRVWSAASLASALKYLYQRIPDDEIGSMPDLQAYYRLDEGKGTEIANKVTTKIRPGTLHGAQWVAMTSPLQSGSSPWAYIDPRGLAFYGGLIQPGSNPRFPKFGELADGSRPYLLSSADGYLHLYYQGTNNQFFVAHYETSSDRAHYGVWWIAGAAAAAQRGYLVFSSRQTGAAFNQAKIKFNLGANGLWKLSLNDGQKGTETWNGLPATVQYSADVLSGRSVQDPADRRLLIGEAVFYDYTGDRRLGFRPVGDPLQKGMLQIVSRNRNSYVCRAMKVTPAGGNTCKVNLTIAYESRVDSSTFSKTLLNVPVGALDFAATINGTSASYDYTNQANAETGEALIYEIPAGGPTFLAIADATVKHMTVNVTAAGTPSVCDVKIDLTLANGSLAAEWKGISRKPETFAAAIRDSQTGNQQKVAEHLHFFVKSPAGMVADGKVDKEADLYALTSFVDVFALNANGDVFPASAPVEFTLPLEKLQSVSDNDNTAELGVGSLLFAAYNGRPADNGFPEVIDAGSSQEISAEPLQPGRDGGWIAESPHSAVAVKFKRSLVQIPLNPAVNKPLAVSGSLTLETWSKPQPPVKSEPVGNLPYPRLIHASFDDQPRGSKYMLGTSYSAALQFLWGQNSNAAKIEIGDLNLPDSNKWLFPKANYSVSVYVKADLTTAKPQKPARVYEIFPLDTPTLPSQRLTVSNEGVLAIEVFLSGTPTSHALNKKLSTDTWTMVTISRQGTTVKTYVDGAPDIEFSIADYPTTPVHHRLLIGDNSDSNPLEMQLNQFAVWQRSLGPADVKDRFNLPLPVDDQSLVLLWRMDAARSDDKVINDALPTGADYDATVKGLFSWRIPGVFLQAFAAVRDHAVSTRGALLGSAAWNQVCAVYECHWGVRLAERAFGDCGNEANLNMSTELSLEVWTNQEQQIAGANQVLFSKFDAKPAGQCYEFGINGNNRSYLQLRLRGRKSLGLNNKKNKIELKDVAEKDLYFSVAGSTAIVRAQDYYIGVTASITSEVKEVTVKDGDKEVKERMNVYTLHAQMYVNGEPDGEPLVSPEMYGEVTINQSSVAANIGRTKPGASPSEQSYYNGQVSDLRLWNRALNADDIKSNFQSVAQDIKGDGLVSAWYFREQEGRVAFDSESDNNATLSNRDLWIAFHASAVLRMVINGEEVPLLKRRPSDFGGYPKPPQICLGGMRNANDAILNTFIGTMDEFRVWGEVRTLDQIRDNKERFLVGNEKNLVGYWRFKAGSGDIVIDNTGLGNDGRFAALDPAEIPVWQQSEAPISGEAGIVLNALGGIETRFLTSISAGPSVLEYADTQLDYRKEAFSIYKRCYIYLDQNGIIQQDTSFKVGDLSRVYLGQVQSKPSLIGYIEGAPPLPSENLTRPYYDSPMAYTNYNNIATVTFTEADDTSLTFSSTRQSGSQLAFGIKGGLAVGYKFDVGVGAEAEVAEATFQLGMGFDLNWGITQNTDASLIYGLTKTGVKSLANTGDWDAPNSAYVSKTKERRYIPANTGYALVKSMTADMYALYLKTTGAMVGFSIIPNLNIPMDNNIIYFPIDSGYTKNGSLDGRVGLHADPDLSPSQKSYFNPVEAYSVKRRIEKEEQELSAYWQQFNAVKRGQAQENDLAKTIADNPVFDFKANRPRLNMVNQYVWTAAGGFFAEKESAMAVSQESHSGSYSFKWNLGVTTQGKFLWGPGTLVGLYFEASLMGGTQWTVTVQKTKKETKSFSLDVVANPDGFLRRYQQKDQQRDLIDSKPPLYSDKNLPGKVDTYRFFSFYLSPGERNFDHFFSKVVDQRWLNLSDDPRAAALREAKANPNPPWRIFHRVTFVSRIPPEFQVFPLDTQAPDTSEPANLAANELLLRMVGDHIGDTPDPTPAAIGAAVRKVLAQDLVKTIPWWQAFLNSAKVENSPDSFLLADLTRDTIAYMIDYYETKPVVRLLS
jgi:large repetitive protein